MAVMQARVSEQGLPWRSGPASCVSEIPPIGSLKYAPLDPEVMEHLADSTDLRPHNVLLSAANVDQCSNTYLGMCWTRQLLPELKTLVTGLTTAQMKELVGLVKQHMLEATHPYYKAVVAKAELYRRESPKAVAAAAAAAAAAG